MGAVVYTRDIPKWEWIGGENMSVNLNRIKAERIAQGYTQEEMASKLGWKRGAYAKRESGKVQIGADDLAKIADVLGYQSDGISIFFKPSDPVRE